MFPGAGSQYVNMGRELYETEQVFREQVDICAALLKSSHGYDLPELLFPGDRDLAQASEKLKPTSAAFPAIFVVEYAMAKLLMSWGVQPDAMIGHSLGEYAAACLAGVFSLAEALALVVLRGRLLDKLPSGAMISVQLSHQELKPLLDEQLCVAATNGPSLCVISGPTEKIDELERALGERGVERRRLQVDVALHSSMVTPILPEFTDFVRKLRLRAPTIPYISSVTGTWIKAEQATNPNFWAQHLRQTVLFSDGIGELLREPGRILLEVGPGRTLSSLAGLQVKPGDEHRIFCSLRHPYDDQSDAKFLRNALGRLWLAGVRVDWPAVYEGETRHRIALPTYPFERRRYWVERQRWNIDSLQRQASLDKKPDIADWFYVPAWRQSVHLQQRESLSRRSVWLLLADDLGLGTRLVERLAHAGQDVICVNKGKSFTRVDDKTYLVDPRRPEDYKALLSELQSQNRIPGAIVHLWGVSQHEGGARSFAGPQEMGFYSLLFLAQAIAGLVLTDPIQLEIVTSEIQQVTGTEQLCPEKVTALGVSKVIQQEYPNVSCRSIDIVWPASSAWQSEKLVDQLISEIAALSSERTVAFRGNHRWVQDFEAIRLTEVKDKSRLRQQGVYLITGGLGRIGLELAHFLAERVEAKLILVSRTTVPEKKDWARWLETVDGRETTSRRIRGLQKLDALGAEYLICQADVADESQMRDVLRQAVERFGDLHGVFHAAGITGDSLRALPDVTEAECQLQFRPKVDGLYVLEEVLRDRKLDFCLLFSSVSALLGGLGHTIYTAANLFIDAFVNQHNQLHQQQWTSVDWELWDFSEGRNETATVGAALNKLALTPPEGMKVIERLLAHESPAQVVVSTGDLETRIRRWVELESTTAEETIEETEAVSGFYPRPDLANDYVAPRNEIEATLAGIWQQFLGIDRVGVYDNFFESGGHSLLATQVMSRVREAFNCDVPLRRLFETLTIGGLAERIQQQMQAAPGATSTSLLVQLAPRDQELPLSFAQQRLWFLDQLEPGSSAYNVSQAVRLNGHFDVDAMEQTLTEIARRHEILRTTFPISNGQPVQVISPTQPVKLEVIDLRHLPKSERDAESHRLAVEEARRPFDLTAGPLMRVTLLRLDEEDHAVLFTMHHIVTDGWSMGVLVREVATLYEAYSRGESSPLTELPIQYADYAKWQRERLQTDILNEQLTYWKQQLDGVPAVLELPTDFPRPPVQTSRGAHHSFFLPHDLTEAIESLSQSEGATPYMTLLAAFQSLLSRYAGQTDICVGSVIAGRTLLEVEELIGLFVNTLVLRTDCSGDPTFRELLSRVRTTALGAQAHQDVPFEKLVEELQPDRELSRHPIFQVLFALHNAPEGALQLSGLALSPMTVENSRAQFDLSLELWVSANGLIGSLEYNTDLFAEATVARLANHYETLLRGIIAKPDARISTLPLLTEAERRQLLVEFNETTVELPLDQCFHQRFEEQVARTPDAVAVTFEEQELTYAELNRRANRVARILIEQGVGPDRLVALLAERNITYLVTIIGVFKAGGAYLPLDPGHPAQRLVRVLEQSETTLVLLADELAPLMTGSLENMPDERRPRVLELEELLRREESDENLPPRSAPHHLAYVMYTSGSTGKPKGVMIEQKGMLNHLLAKVLDLKLTAADTVAQNASQSFDISVWQYLAALLVGGRVCIFRDQVAHDPSMLFEQVERRRITIFETVPSMLRMMLDGIEETLPMHRPVFKSLRWLISNAEALPPKLCRRWFALYPDIPMLNTWGATECSDDVTHLHITNAPEEDLAYMPLGYRLANIKLYIVDEQMSPVPIGVPGELCIAGISVGRGYLNDAERTARSFLIDPFTHEDGLRLYRTGDLGRYLPDGNIEFLGRIDHQVKVRGLRVELGEIEAVLHAHEGVREALVMEHEAKPGDTRLVAYVVVEQDARTLNASELRSHIKQQLPDYMVPASFVLLDEMPLNSNGKVDRRALPAPELSSESLETAYVAPGNTTEEILTGIWAEVLGLERVGINDDFFELGGHSLMATQIISRVRVILNMEVPLRRVFEYPTVAEFARAVEESPAVRSDVPQIEPVARGDQELEQLLAELEQLAEADVPAMLAEEILADP
jgi:amino acid adenylation domain-containing protein